MLISNNIDCDIFTRNLQIVEYKKIINYKFFKLEIKKLQNQNLVKF